MKRLLGPAVVLFLPIGTLRVAAQGGDCRAPAIPDDKPVAGCVAPEYSVNLGPPIALPQETVAVGGLPSATDVVSSMPPAPARPTPPVGSGTGLPMVVDEGMNRVQTTPADANARMMQVAGFADALRGVKINPAYSSNLNYLKGYSDGLVRRALKKEGR